MKPFKTLFATIAFVALTLPTTGLAQMAGYETDATLVEVAAEAGSFETLLAAARAADLAETLGSEGPFTVFAPTDDAFAALPEGTLDTLLKPENKETLKSILLYHVVPGRVMATQAVKLDEAETALGETVDIEVREDGTVLVGGARVIETDVKASNGVIHVIDAVILPPEK